MESTENGARTFGSALLLTGGVGGTDTLGGGGILGTGLSNDLAAGAAARTTLADTSAAGTTGSDAVR